MSKIRVSIMIDEEDDSYILTKCTQHGDKSRFYNVALKNLISHFIWNWEDYLSKHKITA